MINQSFSKEEKQLFRVFLKIKDENEMASFCRDLMTAPEIKELAKRFEIATLLSSHKMTYLEIAKKVQTSTATVTRVNSWLKNGMNGYQKVLERIS